jgi:hypothetical protein
VVLPYWRLKVEAYRSDGRYLAEIREQNGQKDNWERPRQSSTLGDWVDVLDIVAKHASYANRSDVRSQELDVGPDLPPLRLPALPVARASERLDALFKAYDVREHAFWCRVGGDTRVWWLLRSRMMDLNA